MEQDRNESHASLVRDCRGVSGVNVAILVALSTALVPAFAVLGDGLSTTIGGVANSDDPTTFDGSWSLQPRSGEGEEPGDHWEGDARHRGGLAGIVGLLSDSPAAPPVLVAAREENEDERKPFWRRLIDGVLDRVRDDDVVPGLGESQGTQALSAAMLLLKESSGCLSLERLDTMTRASDTELANAANLVASDIALREIVASSSCDGRGAADFAGFLANALLWNLTSRPLSPEDIAVAITSNDGQVPDWAKRPLTIAARLSEELDGRLSADTINALLEMSDDEAARWLADVGLNDMDPAEVREALETLTESGLFDYLDGLLGEGDGAIDTTLFNTALEQAGSLTYDPNGLAEDMRTQGGEARAVADFSERENISLFGGKDRALSVDDFVQSTAAGNCGPMAAIMSTLRSNPNAIRVEPLGEENTYAVHLPGRTEPVVVDSTMAVDDEGNAILANIDSSTGLAPALVVKALNQLQLDGTDAAALDEKTSAQAVGILTGGDVQTTVNANTTTSHIRQRLTQALTQDSVVVAVTHVAHNTTSTSLGLTASHAYEVTAVRGNTVTLNDPHGDEVTMTVDDFALTYHDFSTGQLAATNP